MAFETREFYKELDRHYRALDNEKTCEFLQEMADETRGQHASGDERTYGVSGAETPECNYDYVTVCNEYGCFLRNTSKWERSLETFKEALLELERHQQQDTANYATIRLNMAGTFRQMGNYDKAIELFSESEAFFLNSEDKGKYSYLLASVYNNLSLVYQDKEDYEQAAECGLEALKYLPDHKDVQRATTLNNLAGVCLKQGRLDKAEETVNESIGILKDIDGGMNFH